ncbi:phosphohistidine phosphatase SixA [Aliivibrio sp. S4TY2]|uniref:phosphohistidine phosphatase SixA n=1 Tax=unclassified Aliivibrio TaxID=2645654 RepID=UPI002379EE40|nr:MULTISPECIES: phosphohistidine phosphatase SixA [unclassified Aliivibrio]MDD9154736.1 phosphohistidine phosphatase SixA [Aliivibrio sp. S4TY2]MDD9158901.1 phosphohistidine phosphatase SixA [Aliivibrio sp. S4TY1]MDD9162739.1 phosphohistidine phosphatase SixA [Aliivibrio sp. S4MY2]MDD9166900.1 phosphohistidine phosphatase SixA [Aliivibrio sp. S4MY4]MDD9183816.1 phosphohistidine phosphatase SixA [Aliivibrio sp. S4MY3]
MKVFIMRHGEAEMYAPSDEERNLTPHGESQSAQIAQWLMKTHQVQFDYVLVSPYVRAQQTWNAIKPILNVADAKVETSDEITPYGDSDDVVEYVKALGSVEDIENILIVSHLPLVGYLTADFVPGIMPPMFPTSAISCVEFSHSTGKSDLLWLQQA